MNLIKTNIISQNNRDSVLDVTKGIGILLVVFAHINLIEPGQTIIYSFHMPLFFILSGFFFDKSKYTNFKSFLNRRFHSLIIPYLLYSAFSLFIYSILIIIQSGIGAESFKLILNYIFQIVIDQYSLINPFNVPLWFVLCLFLVEIIYYFVAKINNRILFLITIIAIVTFGWFTESSYCHIDFLVLPWNFSSACFSLGFYAIGNICAPYYKKAVKKLESINRPWLIALAFFVFSFCIVVPLALINGKVSIGSRELNNGFLLYITGFFGTIGTVGLSYIFKKSKLLQLLGRNSFTIMAIHVLIRIFLFKILALFLHSTASVFSRSWPISLIVFFVDIMICILFIFAQKRIFPLLKQRFLTLHNKKN